MLSRVTLSAARQRPFHSASRLAFAQSQSAWRNHNPLTSSSTKPGSFSQPPKATESTRPNTREPLRKVYQSESAPLRYSTNAESSRPRPSQPSQAPRQEASQPLPDLRQGIPSEYDATPQEPLPDLTQGIPSTIDAELRQARRGSASKDSYNITEDAVDPQSPDPADRGGDGIPRSTYISSSDRRRARWLRVVWTALALGTVGYVAYAGRDWSEEEALEHPDIANGYTPGLMYARAVARYGTTVKYYQEPIMKKLLPPAEAANVQPATLVIALEDVLVHIDWTNKSGWRVAKRPGLDYFLRYLHNYYEIVIFSNQSDFIVAPLRKKLDPYLMFHFLSKEGTLYDDGDYVKDLTYLDRDLKKTIAIDCNPKAVKKQPENAIIIPPWNGDPNDTTLVDFIPFLEYIIACEIKDLPGVLKRFEGQNIPVEFARYQKRLREELEAKKAKETPRKGRSMGSLFGLQKSRTQVAGQPLHDAEAEGKIFSDVVRERGHEMYKHLETMLEKEGPKMIAEQEEYEKKMMADAQTTFISDKFGWFRSSSSK